MIFENTSLKMSLNFILLTSLYFFQSTAFNAMPFMYYRAELSCKIDGEWKLCKEQEICENGYEFEYINKNEIESLTMDYGLVCEKRLSEATILSIGFFGGLSAYLLAVLYEIPKNKKTNIIFLLTLIEGICLSSFAIIKDNLVWVTIVIFIWNFGVSYVYSQIFAYSTEMYTPAIQKKSIRLISILIPAGAFLFIVYSYFSCNWINHVAYFSGINMLIASILFKLTSSPPPLLSKLDTPLQSTESHNIQSEEEVSKETQQSFIQDLISKFKSLRKNKNYQFNALIYLFGWSISYLSYSTPFVAFNSLGGDLWTNVFASILIDFIGGFITYYLLSKYDALFLLMKNFQINGIIQTLSILFPKDSLILQIIPILSTKVSTRLGFSTIQTLLPLILPYQYNQLLFNLGNLFGIGLSALLPFYRYLMNLYDLNIFFGVGILSLAYLLMLLKCKTLDQENSEIKSKKIFNNESSSSKKISDEIMKEKLKKSSLIASNVSQMIIDKRVQIEEKRCISQQKTAFDNPMSQETALELEFIPKA